MYFNWRVVASTRERQTFFDEKGLNWVMCAKCGKKLYPIGGHPIAIVPREVGGRAIANNCAILCKECYLEIAKIRQENKSYIIPNVDLLFLNG
jgi:5-methylcytosine-specific restriction endonuclease McrA